MNAKDAIRSSMNLTDFVVKAYLGDLEDADLLQRPAEGCNHIAWQLGHLISSELQLLAAVGAEPTVELPSGFAEAHSKETTGSDDPAAFHDKQTYVDLFEKVRAASVAALDHYPDADLDKDSPEQFRQFCPTMGDVFNLIASHPMMHAGQFVSVRRKLGKPVVI